jgi:lysozyme
MRFNLGGGGIRDFRNMIDAVIKNDFNRAAGEMLNSRWARQVGDRADVLARMMREG